MILDFKYCIYMSYRVSKKFCRGSHNKIEGLGQGNVFSRVFCRDVSCLIIKVAENKELGVLIIGPITKKQQRELVMAIVDNIDFFISRAQYQQNI